MRSARLALVSTVFLSGALTLAVAVVPALRFAYRAPALHVVVETTAALVLVLATFLVSGRVRRRALLNELLLAGAFALLAAASVLFALLAAFGRQGPHGLLSWDGRIGSVLGALLLALAALAPARRLPRRRTLLVVAGVPLLAALTVLLVWLGRGPLPGGVRVTVPARSPAWPDLHGNPPLLALHLLAAVAFGVAAFGFLRRSGRSGDEFLGWVALSAVLAGFSRVNYALYPTRYTDWVYVGDGFRLLSYLVLLAGAMREIDLYWRSQREVAVLEERRRIARNLHDGLAQEIAYLGRNLKALAPADAVQAEQLLRLRGAAERAQLESRQALAALATPVDEPLELVLARAAGEVADRFGVVLELELASGVRLSPVRAESLVRIACEAVANAARHSGSPEVELSLERADGGVRLSVRDRGCGFDTAAPGGGFGLVSMRERAKEVGGRLAIESTPGRGTIVEVAL